ncbi:protein THYLAKOID ASSEMBLY 8, chloroplastic-like [Wolffia australiana]
MAGALPANLAAFRRSSSSSKLNFNGGDPPALCRVVCGPRDNRGPLVRGRTLSTEAILAVQALKRASMAEDSSNVDRVVSTTLSRLLKADLVAALTELQRQNHCSLALSVFVAMRREIWYSVDYAAYAQMISALARNGLTAEIDDLVSDLMAEEGVDDDLRGYARLMKALIAAGKGKAVWELYKGMKNKGFVGDEYSFLVVCKGLRRLGAREEADEVERDYAAWCDERGRIRV